MTFGNTNNKQKIKCRCNICKKNRDIEKAIKNKDTDSLISFVRFLCIDKVNNETDIQYYKSILDGSWPNGKEILENALKKYE